MSKVIISKIHLFFLNALFEIFQPFGYLDVIVISKLFIHSLGAFHCKYILPRFKIKVTFGEISLKLRQRIGMLLETM
jgi:hypothetical protein